MIIWIRLFLVLLIVSCINISFAASQLQKSIEKLTSDIDALVKTKKIPGCAVAIVDHDRIVFIKAFGARKLEKGKKSEKINLDTVFQLGSISKPITATLIAILQKKGQLHVDYKVKPYLPWMHAHTTVRHLLSHSSGYVRTGWNNKIENNTPRITILNDLSVYPQSAPGTSFDYHNLVFSLLEDVLVCTHKATLADLLRNYVFKPLGMRNASSGYSSYERSLNKAWPHTVNKKEALNACSTASQFYHHIVPSAGGINASIRDVANFLFLQINGLPNIATTFDLAIFHTPLIETKDSLLWFKEETNGAEIKTWYGLGWRIVDIGKERIVFHGGWLKGFKNFLAFKPGRKLGIVILHNGEGNFSKKAAIQFLQSVA